MSNQDSNPQRALEYALQELEQRLDAGQADAVERLLEKYPKLRSDESLCIELIYSEYVARKKRGDSCSEQEYFDRFPKLQSKLRRLLAIDQAVWVEDSTKAFESKLTAVESPSRRRPDPPPEIPDYEILESLGQGAMGVVYKARHVSLNRVVALKMIRSGIGADSDELARFRIEGQAVASLDHPNVVQIFDVGEVDGRPFFSQEYVDGGSLKERIQRGPIAPMDAAAVVEKIARAIHFAHQRGIVHRDLKPSNVLLVSETQPKVSDFGLAKRMDAESQQTRSGAMIGTPSYMAPEQVNRQHGDIGVTTDVYGVGAILYEILTRQAPFAGSSVWETITKVCTEEPSSIGSISPEVPSDLATICVACLQKRPEQRYSTALELADDLRRFQSNEPIKVKRIGRIRRIGMWAQRKPSVAALVVLIIVVVSASATIGAISLTTRIKHNASVAQEIDVELQQVEQFRADFENADSIDMEQWAEATARMRRAETLVNSLPAADARHRRVADLVTSLDRQARIRKLKDEVERLRLRNRHLDELALSPQELDAQYRAAFTEFGIDPETDLAHDIAGAFGERDRDWLVQALDEWAHILRTLEESTQSTTSWRRATETAERLDQSPLRQKIRQAWRENDSESLRNLASEAMASNADLQSRIMLAGELRDIGDSDLAIAIIEEIDRQAPNDFWVNLDMAIMCQLTEPTRLDDALRYGQCAIAISPSYAGGFAVVGDILLQLRRYEEALELYHHALELEPTLDPIRNNVAVAHLRLGQPELARGVLESLVQADHGVKSALVNLGGVYFQLREHELARDVYKRLIQVEPDHHLHHFQLAMAFMELGQFDESIKELSDCIDLPGEPTQAQAMASIRLPYVKTLRDIALDLPASIDDLSGDISVDRILGFAQVCLLQGKYQQSAEYYELALSERDLFDDRREIEAVQNINGALATAIAARLSHAGRIDEEHESTVQFLARSYRHLDRALDCLEMLKNDPTKSEEVDAVRSKIVGVQDRIAFRPLQSLEDLEELGVPEPEKWLALWKRARRLLPERI